jgi:hypothetical protein
VNACQVRLISAIAASTVIGVGVVVAAATEPTHSASGSTMQIGVTETATTPPTAPTPAKAVPNVTGPAPLPSEEQGLPG